MNDNDNKQASKHNTRPARHDT